jgi:hypothetical protein
MTRKSVTTLTLSVRMRLPPGATQSQAKEFLENAIEDRVKHEAAYTPALPIASLATQEIVIKTIAKTTAYL